jgi:hypothetical protein
MNEERIKTKGKINKKTKKERKANKERGMKERKKERNKQTNNDSSSSRRRCGHALKPLYDRILDGWRSYVEAADARALTTPDTI